MKWTKIRNFSGSFAQPRNHIKAHLLVYEGVQLLLMTRYVRNKSVWALKHCHLLDFIFGIMKE